MSPCRESGDEDNSRTKSISLTFDDEADRPTEISVHVDNTRDLAQSLSKISLSVGENEVSLMEVSSLKLDEKANGWFTLRSKSAWAFYKLDIVSSGQKGRLRQIKAYVPGIGLFLRSDTNGSDTRYRFRNSDASEVDHVIAAQTRQAECLRVFRDLTLQIFTVLTRRYRAV